MTAESSLLFFHEDQSQIHRYRSDRCAYAEKENHFPGRISFLIIRVNSETEEYGSMMRIIEHPGLVWAPSRSE